MCAISIYMCCNIYFRYFVYIYLSLFLSYGFFFLKKRKKVECVYYSQQSEHTNCCRVGGFLYTNGMMDRFADRAHTEEPRSPYCWDGHPSLPCIYIEYFSQRSFFLFLFPFSIRLVKCYSHLSRFFLEWPCPPPRANASQQQSFHLKERPSFFKSLILILYFYIDSLCAVHVCI